MKQGTKASGPAKKRFTVTMTPDMEPALLKLKQDQFFNRSHTEMIQHLIRLGLESAKKGATA